MPASSAGDESLAMKSSPLLEFRSSSFAVTPGEDDATNPGIFGKSLANWLAQQISADGFVAGEIIAEDFGWCVPVKTEPHRLYIACSSEDGNPDSWLVFVFAEGGLFARLLGRDARAESVATLYDSLKRLLQSSPEIQELRVQDNT